MGEAEPPVVCELREYTDDRSRRVTTQTPLGKGPVQYLGHATGSFALSGQTQFLRYTYPIVADSVRAAFEAMEYANQEAWPAIRDAHLSRLREAAQPKVVRAGMGTGRVMKRVLPS